MQFENSDDDEVIDLTMSLEELLEKKKIRDEEKKEDDHLLAEVAVDPYSPDWLDLEDERKARLANLTTRQERVAPRFSSDDVCPICTNKSPRCAALHCGHLFCVPCLGAWKDIQFGLPVSWTSVPWEHDSVIRVRYTCPKCKAPIQHEDAKIIKWKDAPVAVVVPSPPSPPSVAPPKRKLRFTRVIRPVFGPEPSPGFVCPLLDDGSETEDDQPLPKRSAPLRV